MIVCVIQVGFTFISSANILANYTVTLAVYRGRNTRIVICGYIVLQLIIGNLVLLRFSYKNLRVTRSVFIAFQLVSRFKSRLKGCGAANDHRISSFSSWCALFESFSDKKKHNHTLKSLVVLGVLPFKQKTIHMWSTLDLIAAVQ